MPRALPCRVSTGAPRPTGSTPSSSSAPFWAGCAASGTTARCARSRPSQRRMPCARTASARPSLVSKPPSSTASRRPWRDSASVASIQAQEGAAAPGTPAHARGRADPAEHHRGAAARPGAQAARCRADPADREDARRATDARPQGWTKSDGPRSDACDRHWHRDRGHAG